MRDYDEQVKLVKALRYCADHPICFSLKCPYRTTPRASSCFDFLKLDAADAIEEVVAERDQFREQAKMVPKWIPVTERLPDEDMEVLISYRYKEGEGDTNHVNIDITTYGQMYFGGREVKRVKHWRPPFEYFSSNYEVVAWMPLPEPPKEVLPNGEV